MQVTIRLPAASPRLYLEWVRWWREVERFEAGLAREAVAGIDAGPTEPAVERVTPIFIRLIEVQAEDAIRLAAGSIGWPELVSSGRLAFSGDPFLALRFPALFRLPAG